MVKKKCPKDAILTSNPLITFFKFFKIFILQTLFFSKINKIRTNQTRIFLVFEFDVFQSFDVDFWPLLKTEKVLPPSRFVGKFYFLPSILIYKLLFSRIPFISRKEWPILTAIVLIVKKIKGITNEKSFYLVIHFSR